MVILDTFTNWLICLFFITLIVSAILWACFSSYFEYKTNKKIDELNEEIRELRMREYWRELGKK